MVSAFRAAATRWRVVRARSPEELRRLGGRRAPEILVSDVAPYGSYVPAVSGGRC